MNNIQINKIKEYEKSTNIRKISFISLFLCLAIVLPLGFYILTINEALPFKNVDSESFDSRMKDSFLFAFILFGCLLLLIGPFVFIINNMFKRYLKFIRTLNVDDAEKLLSLNEKENFIYKYMPSYIVKENTITFFTMFHQNTINFNDIISIEVRQIFHKGYKAFVVIKTLNNKYSYTLSGNSFKVRNLITEALTANPKIINNENWNY
ncbi:hypothetical protein [Epilithonimonas zeae]|uniref:hypothetical protein n=1 Tax=Epilithonimonas zeae TaxID=1416779 RepID=UPI00200EB290|nr:hypothetical protein [Epilithonimonas zeae]UQB69975.1 hypothetical protein KI430_05990 [Epilithonimonas zeae]